MIPNVLNNYNKKNFFKLFVYYTPIPTLNFQKFLNFYNNKN